MRVAIYGNTTGGHVNGFIQALDQQCTVLGIRLDTGAATAASPANLNVVFADSATTWTAAEEQELQQLVERADPVLPVIDTAADASFLPPPIAGINAFKRSDYGPTSWLASLVDEALGMAWLRRRTRKVFISYRRLDSAAVANQIFYRFNRLGYEVFLDDASIDRGADFQRELKWWLNDADLLLALCSPRLADSKWCLEELNFAQARSIGIAALEWPEQLYDATSGIQFAGASGWTKPLFLNGTMPDQRHELQLGDFVGVNQDSPPQDPDLPTRELTPEALEKVVALCARNRATAIRARLNDLLPLVRATLVSQGATNVAQAFGDLTYRDALGKKCFVRVLPFRPLPEHIHQAYTATNDSSLAACAYAESDVKDVRASALRWLAEKTRSTPQAGVPDSALWPFCGGAPL